MKKVKIIKRCGLKSKVVKTYNILEKKDYLKVKKEFKNRGSSLCEFLSENGYSASWGYNLVLFQEPADKFINLVRKAGIRI